MKFLHIAGKPLDNSNLVKENDRRWLWVSYLRQESELLEGKQKANEENKSVCFGTSREASDAFFFVVGNTMDDEIGAVAKLKLASGTILESRVD